MLEEDVFRLVQQLWSVTLGLTPVRVAGREAQELTAPISSRVELDGAWGGVVELCCDEAMARGAAAAMFDLAPEDLSAAQLEDAVGELTNVLSGNLKRLLPRPTEMSTPAVWRRRLEPAPHGAVKLLLLCDEARFEVRVVARRGARAEARR